MNGLDRTDEYVVIRLTRAEATLLAEIVGERMGINRAGIDYGREQAERRDQTLERAAAYAEQMSVLESLLGKVR